MPDTQVYISDFGLQRSASLFSGVLDATATVRLFKNAWLPTNNQGIGSFSEMTFAGYAGVALAGRSQGVRQLASGVWELQFGQFYFTATGGPTQYANGWYLSDAGGNFLGAQPFPTPKFFSSGVTLAIVVKMQFRGLNLGCP